MSGDEVHVVFVSCLSSALTCYSLFYMNLILSSSSTVDACIEKMVTNFVLVLLISTIILSETTKTEVTNTDVITVIKELKQSIRGITKNVEEVKVELRRLTKDVNKMKDDLKEDHRYRTIKPYVTIKRDTLLATLPRVEKEYSVEFYVYPTEFKGGYHNVLHFTIGGDRAAYGDRIPGVWFDDSGKGHLHIAASINGISNYFYTTSTRYPTKEWIKVRIWQSNIEQRYVYRVAINGEVVVNVTNSKPQVFENVKVFVADNWYETQPGYIRNLLIM